MARRSNNAEAAAVSRALARGGHRPIPSGAGYGREGLHVKRTALGDALVVASYDSPVRARQALAGADDILRDAGYHVQTSGEIMLVVTKAAA